MALVIKGSYRYEQNFWDTDNNSDLLALKAFKSLYQIDNHPSKEESSKIMWAIYLIYDYASQLATLPLAQRVQIIEDDFLNKPKYFTQYQAQLNPAIQEYLNLQKGSERRYLDTWQEAVEKRRYFMEQTPYEKTTWEMLDKMLLSSDKILGQKEEILRRIEIQEGGQIKGGQTLSALAKGELVIREEVNESKRDDFIERKIDYNVKPKTKKIKDVE